MEVVVLEKPADVHGRDRGPSLVIRMVTRFGAGPHDAGRPVEIAHRTIG